MFRKPLVRVVLVVKESQWLRGEGAELSKLRRSRDGKMCCLGFACIQSGVPESAITDVEMPYRIDRSVKVPVNLRASHIMSLPYIASDINDFPGTSDEYKKIALTDLFKTHNIELVFVP